jgi:hypothetical protein
MPSQIRSRDFRAVDELNPQTELAMNWHLEAIAAKLTAVRQGKIGGRSLTCRPARLTVGEGQIAGPDWRKTNLGSLI